MSDVPVALKRLELDLKRGDVNGDIYRPYIIIWSCLLKR